MKKYLKKIFEQILPTMLCIKTNKNLKLKIESSKSQSNVLCIDNNDRILIDDFRQKYLETFEIKNRLEDKAKTNVIGITIAITLIMGSSGIINPIINKFPFIWLHWGAFLILIFAALYLLVAGIDAIKVLFVENTMSVMDLTDFSLDSIGIKAKYNDCTNRNILRNIIRNNYIFASYICIRNSLICMIVLLIPITIPAIIF